MLIKSSCTGHKLWLCRQCCPDSLHVMPALAGQKRHLRWLRHYLVSVTRSGGPGGAAPNLALHLYDLRKKLVAATLPLQAVRCRAHASHLAFLPR